jgi:opacity protein-like surface antigen
VTTTLGGGASFTVTDTVVENVTYRLLDLGVSSIPVKQVTVTFTP